MLYYTNRSCRIALWSIQEQSCKGDLKQTRDFIKEMNILPFGDCVETFAKERVQLWSDGKKIEDFDLLISCAAKAAGLTIVTHNVKHFNHIEGIKIEDWVK